MNKRNVVPVESPVVSEGPSEPSEGLPETFTREDVDRLVREARAAKDEEFQQWKERANEVAIEYAIENDLCGEFERCRATRDVRRHRVRPERRRGARRGH